MTVEERIVITKQRARRLLDLMEDPHPGLSTWTQMVGQACDEIAELSPSYEKKENVFRVSK